MESNLDFDDVRLFAKVAELKSFVSAAHELNLQTSFLSRRIARLEAALGVRLLHRTTRKVSLTSEGERFYAESAVGIEQLRAAAESLRSAHGEASGRIRLSSPIEIGHYLVESALPGFLKLHPKISVEWDLLHAEMLLIENGIDIAITAQKPSQQTLIEKKIGSTSFMLYRSPDFEMPTKGQLNPRALEQLAWNVFTRTTLDSNRPKFNITIEGKQYEIRPKNVRFRSNSLVSVRHAIVNGIGVGFLPIPIAAADVQAGKLVAIQPKKLSGQTVDFYAVYPSKEYLAPKTRILIDWLSENFPFQPAKKDVQLRTST